ncbi:MAG TPA: endonuclease/exonuclease/phosphatase family protein [Planctomycetota bacterium]|nr:endonuclease/exonuclease/phosphatase family protein [Planctomycetota bacterium]
MSGAGLLLAMVICAGAGPAAAPPGAPPAKSGSVRVLTWNIQYGADRGDEVNGWPERKELLRRALEDERPDLLCVQEALAGQLEFVDGVLPRHSRDGVGRDDGRKAGEHCAIYWDKQRFERSAGGTFWLSETPDKPGPSWGEQYNRVCTWVRLKDNTAGRTLRVFNVHLPLLEEARKKAAGLVAERVKGSPEGDALIVAGDLNSGPESPAWAALEAIGLVNAEAAAGRKPGTATFHRNGIPLVCLDAIFAAKSWTAKEHRVIGGLLQKAYPSDHFGVAAVLEYGE